MPYLEVLVITALTAAISDWVIQAFKKSPSHIVAPFIRLWKENSYLHNILHKVDKDLEKAQINRFARWRDIHGKYVSLKGNKLEKGLEGKSIVTDILREWIRNSTPAILAGDPGSGKTTTLEALTYQVAASSYRINIFLWLGFLCLACLLLFISPLISFLYLMSFFLWEPLICRTPIPIFVEARYLTDEIANMEKWCDDQRMEKIGGKPIFGSQHRIIWLIDGVNELTSDALYGSFIKGWRKLTQDGKVTHAIFSDRTWASLSNALGIKSLIEISELDDNLVRRFLQNQKEYDELETKQLLAKGGIGRNPYWLTMIVESGVYTQNKGRVIYGYIDELLKREIDVTKPPQSDDVIPKDHMLRALANLGMTLEKENILSLNGKNAWNRAVSILESSVSNQYKGKIIIDKAKEASLLRQDGQGISFAHPFIQTFFAAYDLYLGEDWKQILDLTDDLRWWQIFLFLGDIIADQSPENYEIFVESILSDGESVKRTYLASAILESTLTIGSADFLKTFDILSPSFKWNHLLSRHFHSFMSDIEQKIVIGLLKGALNKGIDEHQNPINKLREIQGDSVLESLAAYFFVDDYGRPEIAQAVIRIFQSVGDKKASEYIVLMLGYEKTKDVAYDSLVKIGGSAVDPLLNALGWRKFEDLSASLIEHMSIEESRNTDLDKQIQFLRSLIEATEDRASVTLYRKRLQGLMTAQDIRNGVRSSFDDLNQILSMLSEDELHKQRADFILEELRKQGNEELVTIYSQYLQKSWELGKRIADYRIVQKILCEIGDSTVPHLINCLSNNFLRERAAETLGMIGNADAINALATLLNDHSLAHIAYSPLEKIGEPALLDVLFQLLNSDNLDASMSASEMLRRLDHKVVFERLTNIIGQDNFSLYAVTLLTDLLEEQENKTDAILSILDKADEIVAIHFLPQIIEMGDIAIEFLVSKVETQEHKIRESVLSTLVDLAFLGIERDYIIHELLRILQSDDIDPSERSRLLTGLIPIGEPIINPLGKLLENENASYWPQVVHSLCQIAAEFHIAPKPLMATLGSTNAKIRMLALSYLMLIGNLSFFPYILARMPHEPKTWRKLFIRMLPHYLFMSIRAILNYPTWRRIRGEHREILARFRTMRELDVSQRRK